MYFPLLGILGWIALVDARSHRIPNKAVLLLALVALIPLDPLHINWGSRLLVTLIILVATLALALFVGLGLGDVKLLSVLSLLVLPPQVVTYQLFLSSVSLSAVIYALFISRGELRKSLHIPLAPAIFCGTIATLIAK
jgi:leader peptidase (prepilin peptidase)/N-methyltransferase